MFEKRQNKKKKKNVWIGEKNNTNCEGGGRSSACWTKSKAKYVSVFVLNLRQAKNGVSSVIAIMGLSPVKHQRKLET